MAGRRDLPSALRGFIIDNIKLGKQIGRGANGRILEAKWEGATIAVKEIHSIFIDDVSEPEFQAFKTTFLRECEQSSRLRHPNVVRFFGIYWPPAARTPSLVMERLHCSLTGLLEQNPILQIETKVSILHDVALGLRYLHTRTPVIIHRDLSSNNILISKGMEGKIGDLGTVRLVDPTKQSQMTKAPGTVDFMPPEALAAGENIKYKKELDVFSFGCVMLHTLSHRWPTPSEPVVTHPITFEMKAKSEVERRSNYFSEVDEKQSDVLVPMIKSCLHNIPKNRALIVTVCNQLGVLVEKQNLSTDDVDLSLSALKQKMEGKDVQIQSQAAEIEALRSHMAKLQMQLKTNDPLSLKAVTLSRQVSITVNYID